VTKDPASSLSAEARSASPGPAKSPGSSKDSSKIAGPTIAIYGGSFDPPHLAHVLSVAAVLSVHPVDAVWVLPVHRHPTGKRPTPWSARLALCSAAFSLFGDRVQVREDERDLGGAGRTWDLLQHLRARYPTHHFRLMIGSDQLTLRHTWYRFDEICQLAPPILLARPGHPVDPAFGRAIPMPAMSSTEARLALDAGACPPWLPAAVQAHIAAERLYGWPVDTTSAAGREHD